MEKPELKEIDTEDDDVETYEYGTCKIHIRRDDSVSDSPREWSNLFTWYSNSRRHDFDGHSITELEDGETEREPGESVADYFRRMNPDKFILPIYGYEHGGIALSTASFSDPWDSGLFALGAVDKEEFEKEVKVPEGKTAEDRAFEILEGEVETMNRYLNGDVYGYVVEDADGNETDSCWGFYCEPKEVAEEGTACVSVKDMTMVSLGSVDLVNRINERSELHIFRVSWVDETKDGEKRYVVGVRLGFDDGMHEGVVETPVMDEQDLARQLGYQKGEFEGHCLKVWNETYEPENKLDSDESNG